MPFETIYDIQLDGCRYGIVPVIVAVPLLWSAFDWYRGKRWVRLHGQSQPGFSPKVACMFFGILAAVAFFSFDVAGQSFSFSKFAVKQGFNTLSIEGSPMADGRTVRVHHVQGQIVKLEIAP